MKQFRRAPLPSLPVPRTWRRAVASARAGFASAEMKEHGRMATLTLVERVEIFPPENECVSEGATVAILFMLFAVVYICIKFQCEYI